ncbi:protein ROOT PRIMORDIUM DEFECTIVE 1 isoform X2 [Arabidopsis lyrata subsp. lyrata]|uniref:protein ROOT PRIMORDIUM DEFECTIVE 1 isoform X2 n=1 Tax=Arabidopsis lyrata subsp. lyrata TaxID=81972 RepID=UPI000A29C5AB|nr:protein ROOT PRIMORDIUM DEFECTIVE 1 isoform X2 [Arabidopsis lyrata subsp. lyrata]|eukprot:XP_020865806.1 protein ROOT PRIMORDIUM DEFECTIVE 1 isoform X2 [Arabidopsis lyrata subsp. lyrata]
MSKPLLYRRCSISSGLIQILRIDMLRETENFFLFPGSRSQWTVVQVRHKSGGGGWRPKQKVYHRVHELDKAIDLNKKPALILQLKSIIQAQKHGSLLLRDLEKHVGFVHKWNLMAAIEKYPSIFYVGGGNKEPPFVMLTEKANKIAAEEGEATESMEPILVNNLRKLLMMSVDCRVPLEKVEFIQSAMGLPQDFKSTLIPKYPEFFSLKVINGKVNLVLENWDSSLATTAREDRLSREGVPESVGDRKRVRITKDGNFLGRNAFKVSFPPGFRPNASYLEEFEKWQKMEFPSPYLNARRFDAADPKARKRVVAVLHELLSLTMEKRVTCAQLDAFHSEYLLPSRLILCLIKHQGIFYITNKGARGKGGPELMWLVKASWEKSQREKQLSRTPQSPILDLSRIHVQKQK